MSPHLSQELADRSAGAPDQVAVVAGAEELTYRELGERVAALAARLAAGPGPGSVVGLATPRSIDGVVGMLATWWAGCTYLALDPTQPPARLREMVSTARADVVLVPDGDRPSWVEDVSVTEVGGRTGDGIAPLPPADIAYIVFTSGSTGRPKGIEMPASAVARLARWHQLEDQTGVRTALFAAVGFDVAIQEVLATLFCGGTLVVVDEQTRRDPTRLLELVRVHNVHRLFLPIAALQPIAERAHRRGDGEPLRDVICAGDQLLVTPAVRGWFSRLSGARLHNHYGPAETHVVTTHVLAGDPARWPDVAPIGRPLPHVRLEIADADPSGQGELVVGGPQLARGYVGRPDLTAERFVGAGEQRGYRTGDLVAWRNAVLVFHGRRDRQVKIRGYRVELDEVEAHLAQHPQLAQSAVDAVDVAGERDLVAYLVSLAGERVTGREIRDFLAERLPSYSVPGRLHMLERLPITVNGKLDRAAAAALAARPDRAPSPLPTAAQGIESLVSDAFERVLGHRDFTWNENFFDIGGTSARAARVITLIADTLATELPVVMFYDNPTVASLSRALSPTVPQAADDAGVRARRRNVHTRAQSARREARRDRRATS
ncbi:MAG: non-ribosomal peptide synthetase [Streptosporangiaceae bacterium]|nr:non-ribosomal peptide synthetase [Streptosporangiaceae bacterium]